MHVGNLRTALVNALFAASQQGTFHVRIEDTDRARSEERYAQALMEDLKWMGCAWADPVVRQSDRDAIYEKYYTLLIDSGLAYPCYCTDNELKVLRKTQLQAGQPPRYPGTCRYLSHEQCARKEAGGQQASLRLRMPDEGELRFEDQIFGLKIFSFSDLGDFVIRKSDGSPSFMFCNAIDDAMMGITHVLRGEDHLTNTPRQIHILNTLKLKPPQYGHLPIIVGVDGKPLSKRNGSASVAELRASGFLPEALWNHLARLGHHYKQEGWLDPEALVAGFDLKHVGRAPAQYTLEQRMYWQKEAIKHASEASFAQWLSDVAPDQHIPEAQHSLLREVVAEPGDLSAWQSALGTEAPDYSPEARQIIAQAPELLDQVWAASERTTAEERWAYIKDNSPYKGKALFRPLRYLLTGRGDGPEMVRLLGVLSAEALRARVIHLKES